jgi:hypothetical protein
VIFLIFNFSEAMKFKSGAGRGGALGRAGRSGPRRLSAAFPAAVPGAFRPVPGGGDGTETAAAVGRAAGPI